MRIFSNTNRKQKELNPFVLQFLLFLKNKLQRMASWLQQKTMSCPPNKLKMLLLIFCFGFFGESLWVIHQSLNQKPTGFYMITPFHPVSLIKEKNYHTVISRRDFKRINDFKIYLDSLRHTTAGKSKYDSLTASRPFIMDSINLLENLYYEQQANAK